LLGGAEGRCARSLENANESVGMGWSLQSSTRLLAAACGTECADDRQDCASRPVDRLRGRKRVWRRIPPASCAGGGRGARHPPAYSSRQESTAPVDSCGQCGPSLCRAPEPNLWTGPGSWVAVQPTGSGRAPWNGARGDQPVHVAI
jgi:hypothetical protein